jgi:peptide/nickel transport system permease protein
MIYGTRVSLTIGFLAVGLYLTIGVFVGAIAGYFGGWVDMVVSRVIEIMLLFPSFFLILTLVAMFGPSVLIIMFVIGITGWPTVARLIRGEVLKQRGLDYVQAARAIGVSHLRVLFRHILPNALSPALVAAPFGIANAIITEAGRARDSCSTSAPTWERCCDPAITTIVADRYPVLMIFFTVTVFNQVGSGLPRRHGPRLRA